MILSVILLAAVNLGTLQGIDCSGHTDSSAALNSAFQNLSNNKLVIPSGCQIRADSPLLIQGQESFLIEGEGDRPMILGGPSIFGCNGTAGALLTINRSGLGTLRGFGIFPQGITSQCPASRFTGSIAIDNSGTSGYSTTHINIEHMAFTTNVQGGALPGYVAVNIIGTPNTEHIILRDNTMHGQNSPNSCGIFMQGKNSDSDSAEDNTIANFYRGVCHIAGNMRIEHNQFGNNGKFSVFGSGGADIFISYWVSGPLNIVYNESSESGPFINMNNEQPTCCGGINMTGNIVGISDIGPNQYPVNLGTGPVGPYIFIGNDFSVSGKTSKPVIGSDSQGCTPYGPLGTLIDIGNINHFPGNTGGWTGCGKDFQYGHTKVMSNCNTQGNSCSN